MVQRGVGRGSWRAAEKMEEALRAYILAMPGIFDAVTKRVDWSLSPQGRPYPSIVLWNISDIEQMNLAAPSGWTRSRVQIDIWADTHKIAKDLSLSIAPRGIKAGLNGLRATFGGYRFRIFVIDRDASTDEDKAVSSGVVHRFRLDLDVWHSKAGA
ncbi:MAG: hypothetical protein CMN63_06840 [Sphingobium sp.]|mgnify:CR=1 FL=1|nr:hypothetical protein [Sphingobium sp.]|tara:strand:+ start:499 stop:966 length:468 start_codon:yes stop_codon:yes gene_type:complete